MSRDQDNLSAAKRALYEIRTLKAKVAELESSRKEPLAIVGLGLRFPGGSSSPEAFWDLLAQGIDAVTEVPPSRWSMDRYYDADPDRPGKMYARHGAFLDDPALFDADFFGISPREAISLDPQHRLVMEVAWEALENAGYNPLGLAGSASGVFLAASNSDYGRMVFKRTSEIDAYSSLGNVFSVMSGRISYLLGLQGPSMVVDTACSGSLVALHLAAQSLRAQECNLAVAGGVNLILSPELNINFSKSRMMSVEGRCKTFDADADGYVRGEGCGVVVLKRLSDAVTDGDRVLAVIHATAVNQDGHSSGVTAPNGTAQEDLIRKALADAGIQPVEIDYLEAHGTGTALGDPIEARAIEAVLAAGRTAANPLIVGAVKTNIGHLEAAAGVASLIKTVLALDHQQIPPHLHFRKLNPHIEWGDTVQVAGDGRPWASGGKRRMAGVSSFGFSGTNAHVIVGEAPAAPSAAREFERPLHLLTLSARSAAALAEQRTRFSAELRCSRHELGDICFTANAGRAPFAHRAAYIGADPQTILEAPVAQGIRTDTPEIVFLFPGQGAQFAGMARELYETQPVFRSTMDRCAELLRGELEKPLLEVLWGSSTELVEQTAYTQPALFAVEYALSVLWRSWGIEPAAVLGHSVGEYVAACAAGVYGLEEGIRLITLRGRLMQAVAGRGMMAAVTAPEQQVKSWLRAYNGHVAIAAVNGPRSVVISGYQADVDAAMAALGQQGVAVQRLAVSHGFHSPQMDAMTEAFAAAVTQITWRTPEVKLISSLTGRMLQPEEMADPNYWRRQVREPVQFQKAIRSLDGYCVFIEVGPGTTLAGLGRQSLDNPDILWLPSVRRQSGDWRQMLESLGALFVRGAEIDWAGFDKPYNRRRVSLPTYPFERQRYWLDPAGDQPEADRDPASVWDSVVGVARHQASHGPLDLNVSTYREKWAALDALATGYVIAALHQLGMFATAGEKLSPAAARERYGIRPVYEKLLKRWWNRLVAEKRLSREGEEYVALQPLAPESIEALLARAERTFVETRVLLDLTVRCGESLAEVITGKKEALELLFPGGDLSGAEMLYEREPVSAYANEITQAALREFARLRSSGMMRVLEIGAGTGATTSSLLPVLTPERTLFDFTDVSDSFLSAAERKFASYPFVRYGRFDVESNPQDQGYAAGTYDVVTATNVIHATRSLRVAIRNTRRLLAPGGLLILSETTEAFGWLDATVALIAGWQRFEDGLREDQPLLRGDVWRRLLEEGGFERILSLPDDSSVAATLGRRILIAQVPGGARARSPDSGIAAEMPQRSVVKPPEDATAELVAILQAPPVERHARLLEFVRALIAAMLRFDKPERVDLKRRLVDVGIDSLLALELRSRLTGALATSHRLPATLVYDYPTVEDLTTYLEREVLLLEDSNAGEKASGEMSKRASELESLDDSAVEALLLEKLRSI